MTSLTRRHVLGAATCAAAVSSLPRTAFAAEKADVIVVGAGLSGLNSAMILAGEGLNVRVLEADSRPGGRIRTLDHTDLKYDAGGSEVGPLYARTRDLAYRLNIPLYGYIPPPVRGMAIHIGGRLVAPNDWNDAPENTLTGALREKQPYLTSGVLMRQAKAKGFALSDPAQWLEPGHPMGAKSYKDLLRTLGADETSLRFDHVHAPIRETSALFMLRRSYMRGLSRGVGQLDHVKGGMSRLTDAMAGSLGESVSYNARVARIAQTTRGVEVTTVGGRRYQAARAIVTLPLTMLDKIDWDMPVPPATRAAWASVPYGKATSVFFPIKDPYWEADGLPPNIWSTTLMGRAFLVTNEQGQYLWYYMGGQNAAPSFQWSMADVIAHAEQSLVAARPSLAGRLGTPTAWCWARHQHSQATFASRAPGDLGTLQTVLKAPVGPVHFAGEHSADLSSGIEGALESGERAAIEALTTLL